MRYLLLTVILLFISYPVWPHRADDSLRVVTLLAEGRTVEPACRFMYYAEALKGTPYVAHTLDPKDAREERLIVNMRGLDCTTYIEVVMALTLATDSGTFAGFTYHLQRIRYRNGILDGYASRNHYFAERMWSAERLGVVKIIDEGDAVQTLDVNYMTTHRADYQGISTDDQQYELVRQHEQEMTGRKLRYFSREALRRSDQRQDDGALRRAVHTGDIIGIVTRRRGLDTTHLGIAVWGKDGKLHLLNASRLRGRVVLETRSLYEYMLTQKNQLGIRVVRFCP